MMGGATAESTRRSHYILHDSPPRRHGSLQQDRARHGRSSHTVCDLRRLRFRRSRVGWLVDKAPSRGGEGEKVASGHVATCLKLTQ